MAKTLPSPQTVDNRQSIAPPIPKILAFIHIPKTAGTTLHRILAHRYHPANIRIRHDEQTNEPLTPTPNSPPPSLIMGHFSVGLHQQNPGIRYLTCLRDPVARILSHYHHAKNDPTHYLHQPIIARSMTPADYVSSGLSGELSDGMTRMLAGMDDFHRDTVDDATLQKAIHHLETLFEGIILSEKFDESLLLLAERLGWPPPYYIRRKVGRYHDRTSIPDKSTQAAIERHNQHDRKLYDWAMDRFRKQAEQRPTLAQSTSHFRSQNNGIGKLIVCAREIRHRLQAMSLRLTRKP
jgi:hypothetical protein